MGEQLYKTYDPGIVEDKIYRFWLSGGYFKAKIDESKKPYTIVIPPPNITGQLHMGHALDNTMQDILIRVKRMQGYSALWIPGTDHASIATEARIVETMRQEGVTKDDVGRDGFLERAWRWRQTYGGRIIEQLKKLGSSCDWDRERFTLDEGCSKAVRKVFVDLYNKGLIYRGERIINWCPHCLTSISDAEVEYDEKEGFFYHLKYPLTDGSGYLELATTRPETMLGDTAVAVNPQDERYKHLVGKTVLLPLVNREIPIIADDYVEPDFGTGVVKITPAHDPNDFEVGLRHNLPVITIMSPDATINENGSVYAGLDRYEAREKIMKDLGELGLVSKVEPIKHNIGACYRCGTIVEPRVSEQWFVKMKPLAEPAIDVVRNNSVRFVPDRFDKVYYHWMENINDWCISRQLWWGHRIPAWYCDNCGEVVVSREDPDKCPKCGGALRQDSDTLDTWFSSALWPFSTLGWPDETEDFKYFYPTSTLVTGYDIIFFWVARMIFSAIENTGKTPFDTVLFHGLVRDAQGRKMSKSLGNGIDPLDVIENYGADALRFTLATGNSPGNDMRFSDEKVEASRNFANKIWNAARFILMNDVDAVEPDSLPAKLRIEDKWILSRLNEVIRQVTDNIERFELGIAAQKVNDFIWDIFCDWYIEIAKMRLNGEDAEDRLAVRSILVYVMTRSLQLLHPFMPFITEEIYRALPHKSESIMISEWPTYKKELDFGDDEKEFEYIVDLIKAVRATRAEMNVPPSKKAEMFIETEHGSIFEAGADIIKRLAFTSEVNINSSAAVSDAVQVITAGAKALIPMAELIDREKEAARLNKEKETCEKEIAQYSSRLANESFVSRAPAQVVEAERTKLAAAEAKLEKIVTGLAALN